MRRPSMILSALGLVLSFFMLGCPQTKPPVAAPPPPPPPELVAELAAANAVFQELTPLSPPAAEVAGFRAYLDAAQQAMAKADYVTAMAQARRAHLEAERIYTRLIYAQLEKLNPPNSLTFHCRQQMTASEEAEKAGDFPKAIAAAQEARRQAHLAIVYQQQCLEAAKKTLAGLRETIEQIYRPDLALITAYWDTSDLLATGDCDRLAPKLAELKAIVDSFLTRQVIAQRVFFVTATPEFIRQYGDPIMYSEVTPDGFLRNRVNRVKVGAPVKFIRCLLFARGKTFYFVEDPQTGIQGWMAEPYVWPQRAAQSQGGQ